MNTFRIATGLAAMAAVLTLAGCGSDNDTTEPAATSGQSQDANASRPAGVGLDEAQLTEIRECLDAAGLEDAFPTDLPSGWPSGLPSGVPSDLPSDFDPENFDPDNINPGDLPEGFPSEGLAGQGGGLAAMQDPKVQDALDACGIELPQRPTTPSD